MAMGIYLVLATTFGLMSLTLSCRSGSTAALPPSNSELTLEADRTVVYARVLAVVDGVTIEVDLDGITQQVRYLGVEIPMDRTESRIIDDRAWEYNRFLVEDKTVQLERDAAVSDEVGGLVRYVYVGGEMVNLALITIGHAAVSDDPSVFQYRSDFLAAQENARTGRRGVWEIVVPMPEPKQQPLVDASPTSIPPLVDASPTSIPPLVDASPTSIPPLVDVSPTSVPPLVDASPTSVPPPVDTSPTSVPPLVDTSPTSVPPLVDTSPTSVPSLVDASPTSVSPFSGGTLPPPPRSDRQCDYSLSSRPRIKGNLDERTRERIYLVPESLLYVTTIVDENKGDRWFCFEEEAIAAGFHKSKR